MKSNYKKLGSYIIPCDEKNTGNHIKKLQGISNQKYFQKAKTNIIGVDLEKYRIVRNGQFAFNRATTRNGDKISIALRKGKDCIVSPSYRIFKSKDENILNSEYLMMWFKRQEFDRFARFKSHGSAHEFFDYGEMQDIELPIPSIEKQRDIVQEYNDIQNRIDLNNRLISKLEETAQTIYKEWFVDFEDIIEKQVLEEYVEFNPKHSLSKNQNVNYIEMADLQENSMCIKKTILRDFSAGSKFKNNDTLLARITPCLENGKTGFVNILKDNEIAFGSTEFIVMRAKEKISPFWVYCVAKDENFRLHAISSMTGTSGRRRVHSDYLKEYKIPKIDFEVMQKFNNSVSPIFEKIKFKNKEKNLLIHLNNLLLSKMTKV